MKQVIDPKLNKTIMEIIKKICDSKFENREEMENQNLAKLNPVDTENLNNLISIKVIWSLSKDLSTRNALHLDNFLNSPKDLLKKK